MFYWLLYFNKTSDFLCILPSLVVDIINIINPIKSLTIKYGEKEIFLKLPLIPPNGLLNLVKCKKYKWIIVIIIMINGRIK